MKRNCRAWPCRNIATDSYYCKEHQPKRDDTRTENSYQRGYNRVWRKLRAIKIGMNPICEVCYRKGLISPVEEVDHIIPLREGGRHELENLQSLCIPCHRIKTAEDQKKYGQKESQAL